MAQLIKVDRKSDPLTRPTLACLSQHHTLNLTAGCPYECRYCYARSFRSNPGSGKVHFYANTLELLRQKLPNKRKKPQLVYMSTACEPFSPFPEVLESMYGIMALLLEHGASLLISTKSNPPERFLDLFTRYPTQVCIQVGLTTVNDAIRRLFEPHAASVEERLLAVRRCVDKTVPVEVRCDPLIPQLTDTPNTFAKLCHAVSQCGARDAAASFLFLRRGNLQSMNLTYENWSFQEVLHTVYTSRIKNYCGNSEIRIADPAYRQKRFSLLKDIASSHGINMRFCRCKNPDVTTDCCHPLPRSNSHSPRQTTLFG